MKECNSVNTSTELGLKLNKDPNGRRVNNTLYKQLVANNVAPEIYNIGDSITPGKVFMATKSAFRRAKTI